MIIELLKNKIIITVTAIILVLSLVNVLLYNDINNKLKTATAEGESVKTELKESEVITSSLEQLQQQEIEIKAKYNALCEIFPKEITQEAALEMLKIQSDVAKININNISFDMVEPIDAFNASSLSVKFSFKGNYIGIRNFINLASQNRQKVAIRQMTFNGFGTNLTGSAVVSFYGYKNSLYKFSMPFYSQSTGKDDLFRTFDGGELFVPDSTETAVVDTTKPTTEAKSTIKSDFYMVMNKSTDDASNLIIGKSKKTEITADGNKTNWVNIYFAEKSGKLYYRYRTEAGEYPKNNLTEAFKTVRGNLITINILSNAIMSPNDLSRMQLNVFNDSTKKVQVIVSGADGKTRVIKNVIHGDVEIQYE